MTNDGMTNGAEATGIPHSSFGIRNSSFILHRFDFDPFLEFAAGEKAAGGEFAGDVLAENRAIAGADRASDRRAIGRRRIGRDSRRRRRAGTISIFSPTVSCRQVRCVLARLRSRSITSGQQSARPRVSCVSMSRPPRDSSVPPRGSARHSLSASGNTAARTFRPTIVPSRVSASGRQRMSCASGKSDEWRIVCIASSREITESARYRTRSSRPNSSCRSSRNPSERVRPSSTRSYRFPRSQQSCSQSPVGCASLPSQ